MGFNQNNRELVMKNKIFQIIFFLLVCFFPSSCKIYEKELDNPVDHKADNAPDLPALVFFPKSQSKSLLDTVKVESFIVFYSDSLAPFSAIELSFNYDQSLLELDTIIPGLFITDTNNSTPLFVYNYDTPGMVELLAFFLDEEKIAIEGTGHLADLRFHPLESGVTIVDYQIESCFIYDNNDNMIQLNGKRAAEVIIE